MYSAEERQYILALARRSIGHYLASGRPLRAEEISEPLLSALKEKRACFVTLTIGGQLRGCIGHIEAIQPLYLDVMENAAAAAFDDPRFAPLTAEEFKKVAIEVSVLSEPLPLVFNSPEELLAELRPGFDGVIIRSGSRGATYLPQVWDDLPDKKQFLSSLCLKAGLGPDDWKKPGLRVWTYAAEKIE